jgi:hypothetical protein
VRAQSIGQAHEGIERGVTAGLLQVGDVADRQPSLYRHFAPGVGRVLPGAGAPAHNWSGPPCRNSREIGPPPARASVLMV